MNPNERLAACIVQALKELDGLNPQSRESVQVLLQAALNATGVRGSNLSALPGRDSRYPFVLKHFDADNPPLSAWVVVKPDFVSLGGENMMTNWGYTDPIMLEVWNGEPQLAVHTSINGNDHHVMPLWKLVKENKEYAELLELRDRILDHYSEQIDEPEYITVEEEIRYMPLGALRVLANTLDS